MCAPALHGSALAAAAVNATARAMKGFGMSVSPFLDATSTPPVSTQHDSDRQRARRELRSLRRAKQHRSEHERDANDRRITQPRIQPHANHEPAARTIENTALLDLRARGQKVNDEHDRA